MTKTVQLDDDIYNHLLSRVEDFGETASDVLRRLLELDAGNSRRPHKPSAIGDHELSELLASSEFRLSRGVVGKFLRVLGSAYRKAPEDFERVLNIQGRDRIYFAKSKEAIEESGRNTQPRQIPRSPYWVMTNSPTSQKVSILKEVLVLLDYSNLAIRDATKMVSAG